MAHTLPKSSGTPASRACGARDVAEIGLAGVAAAITAAVYHATGVRVGRAFSPHREANHAVENLAQRSDLNVQPVADCRD